MGLGEIYPVKEEEAEMEEEEEDPPTTTSLGRRGRNIGSARVQPPNENYSEPNSKKIKPDADEQVAQLMMAKPEAVPESRIDMHQKKLAFKIATQLKDSQNKADVDKMYERLMTMSNRETCRPGTDLPLINNKEQLIEVIEALE
jgi:hypothetical protein